MYYITHDNEGNVEISIFERENSIVYEGEMNFYKPKINLETKELYESATPQEIAELQKIKVPQVVTNVQLRLALIKAGHSVIAITGFINSMPNGQQKEEILTLWEYSNYMHRNDSNLIAMATQLNFTEEELNNLFILANTL